MASYKRTDGSLGLSITLDANKSLKPTRQGELAPEQVRW